MNNHWQKLEQILWTARHIEHFKLKIWLDNSQQYSKFSLGSLKTHHQRLCSQRTQVYINGKNISLFFHVAFSPIFCWRQDAHVFHVLIGFFENINLSWNKWPWSYQKLLKYIVYNVLKDCRNIHKAKRHDIILEMTIICVKCCFPFITFFYAQKIVGTSIWSSCLTSPKINNNVLWYLCSHYNNPHTIINFHFIFFTKSINLSTNTFFGGKLVPKS